MSHKFKWQWVSVCQYQFAHPYDRNLCVKIQENELIHRGERTLKLPALRSAIFSHLKTVVFTQKLLVQIITSNYIKLNMNFEVKHTSVIIYIKASINSFL